MLKLILGIIVLLMSAGCDSGPKAAERTLETTPWLFTGPLIEQLSSADFRARAIAARSLGRLGAEAEAAIPELEKLLEDESPEVRKLVEEALEKIRAAVGKE